MCPANPQPRCPRISSNLSGDPSGERTARQARHAISALLSHALPPCRPRLLLLPDVTPREAAEALLPSSPDGMDEGGGGQEGGAGGGAGDGAFGLASDGALELLDWLWPLTHAPARRARRLAQQLHQRLCLEVEAAAAEVADAAAARPGPDEASPGPGGGGAAGGAAGGLGEQGALRAGSLCGRGADRVGLPPHACTLLHITSDVRLLTACAAAPSPGPSARWLRARYPCAAARAAALAPPLALHRGLPPAVAAELGVPQHAQRAAPGQRQEEGPAGVGEVRAWLRGIEAAADWAAWALDQRRVLECCPRACVKGQAHC
jgi:hypothetical protein